MNILSFTKWNWSHLKHFLQSGFAEIGLIDYSVLESLAVRDVIVRKRRSKVCEYMTEWTLVDELKSLDNITYPNHSGIGNIYLVFTDHKLHKVVNQSIRGEGRRVGLTSDYVVKTALTGCVTNWVRHPAD
jgi:hypothetical protein